MRSSGLRQLYPLIILTLLGLLHACTPSAPVIPKAAVGNNLPLDAIPVETEAQAARPAWNFGQHPSGRRAPFKQHTAQHQTRTQTARLPRPTKRTQAPANSTSSIPRLTPAVPSKTVVKPSIELGNQLLAQGKKQAAADVYYRSAFSYASPQRKRIILQAAELAASLGENHLTNSYLQRIPPASLQGEIFARYQYIQALLALQNKQANQALGLLPRGLAPLSPGLRDKVLLVRNRAIQLGGTAIPNYGGQQQYTSSAYPSAPLAAIQTPPMAATTIALPQASDKMAVLLTQSGPLAAVSAEIYQGIQEVQASQGGRTKLYSVSANNALQQYQQAVADGANIVVGPLDKEALAVLLRNPQALSVPILTLNYNTEVASPPTLFQFGLSPEDEAQQIAELTTARGQRQAIVMVPDSAWGKRLADSFIRVYQSHGGQVISLVNYPNRDAGTYLQHVQTALANGRGANMVFLGASPTQARLLRPLLQAQAGMLPVYATSHIFSGRSEPNKDVDLDGTIYTEIPLVLEGIKNGSLNLLKFPRLYAMGADAAMIAAQLPALAQRQQLRGKTGDIRLGPNHSIQRRLNLATFINGVPTPLE